HASSLPETIFASIGRGYFCNCARICAAEFLAQQYTPWTAAREASFPAAERRRLGRGCYTFHPPTRAFRFALVKQGRRMPYRDLREYLQVLEEKGLLCHVPTEVDKDWEISAVCRRTFRTIPQEHRPALMFDCIKGHKIPLVVGVLGASREIYATALETD